MTTAKTSISKLFRAPWNFEEDYTFKDGSYPILFTNPFNSQILPAGTPDFITALDAEAALQTPPVGVSPLLARFSPTPIGATAVFYFPIVRTDGHWAYGWRIVHRLRSVADYTRRKRTRIPYSIGLSRLGTADTRAGTVPGRTHLTIAGSRYVRPAVTDSVIYNRPEPSGNGIGNPYLSHLETDGVYIPANYTNMPWTAFYPGGDPIIDAPLGMDYEQGEADPNTLGSPQQTRRTPASHVAKFVKCLGNEIAVECFKVEGPTGVNPYGQRPWDFTFDGNGNVVGGEDFEFSKLLGVGARGIGLTPPIDTGVRMIVGTWPR